MASADEATVPASAALELRDVRGPSAFGGDPERFWELLWIISVADFKSTYANTALGFAWTIVKPFVFFGVIFLVLREIFNFGADIEYFGQMLVLGLILFTFFSDVTNRSVRSVSAREPMVRKMQFPRIVIPLSIGLSGTFTLLLNLIAVIPLFLATGVDPHPEWLLLVPLVAVLVFFSVGVGMILAVAFVHYEDVGQAWTLASRVLFYATPILYPIDILNPPLTEIISANPLAMLVGQARVWMIDPAMAGPGDAAGVVFGLLIPTALIVSLPLAGLYLFARDAPRMAEAL
jgi:ABC-2 type transport system permease protein